jgi:hypothetical protein
MIKSGQADQPYPDVAVHFDPIEYCISQHFDIMRNSRHPKKTLWAMVSYGMVLSNP